MEGGGEMKREQWSNGGRGRDEGGPMELIHLGSLLPVSIHGCWLLFMGRCLCLQAVLFVHRHLSSFVLISRHSCLFLGGCVCLKAVVFIGGHLHSWLVVPSVWCGGGSLWPFALLCYCLTIHPVTWHCHVAGVVIHVCCGGCEQSLMAGDGHGCWQQW